MPDAKQNSSKLAEMFARACSFNALVGMAVDVVSLFMALLSFVGIITPSLAAQGEQRRFPISTSTGTIPFSKLTQAEVLKLGALKGPYDKVPFLRFDEEAA